jgi:hypothetical protein
MNATRFKRHKGGALTNYRKWKDKVTLLLRYHFISLDSARVETDFFYIATQPQAQLPISSEQPSEVQSHYLANPSLHPCFTAPSEKSQTPNSQNVVVQRVHPFLATNQHSRVMAKATAKTDQLWALVIGLPLRFETTKGMLVSTAALTHNPISVPRKYTSHFYLRRINAATLFQNLQIGPMAYA